MSLESRGRDSTEKQGTETTTYRLESGTTIELTWAHCSPREGREASPGRGVIILSGWGNTRLASMKDLPQAFADASKAESYVLIPRTLERSQKQDGDRNFLFEEARAIARFIKERKLKEITLAGHSMGADRAIDLAAILQSDPETKVNGLILMGPVGVHEQSGAALAANFMAHTTFDIPREVKNLSAKDAPYVRDLSKEGVPQAEIAAKIQKMGSLDGLLSQLSEIGRSGGVGPAFWRRMRSDIADMARKNPLAEQIHCPIVLLIGARDSISAREKVIPIEREREIRQALGEQKKGISLERSWKTGEKPDTDKTFAARERFLRAEYFKNSPYVRMITPEKMGNHLVHIFRPEAVAKVSLFLLERYWREQKKLSSVEKR